MKISERTRLKILVGDDMVDFVSVRVTSSIISNRQFGGRCVFRHTGVNRQMYRRSNTSSGFVKAGK